MPRKRQPPVGARATVHYADLGPDDCSGRVTSPDRTLLDCLRNLPFDEAPAVADSALRSGYLPERLCTLARDARGAGAYAGWRPRPRRWRTIRSSRSCARSPSRCRA